MPLKCQQKTGINSEPGGSSAPPGSDLICNCFTYSSLHISQICANRSGGKRNTKSLDYNDMVIKISTENVVHDTITGH